MLFCQGEVWARVIEESQGRLVDSKFLFGYAEERGRLFCQHTGCPEYKTVPREFINAPCASKLARTLSGYDMPISFQSPGNDPTRYVALIFQDPLRPIKEDNKLTVGIPFALSSFEMRKKKRYEFVYKLIQRINEAGFGVWVTDVTKIWIERKAKLKFTRDEKRQLNDEQTQSLKEELGIVRPKLVIAFGNRAQNTLRNCGIEFRPHPHPGARSGTALKKIYGLTNGRFGFDYKYSAAWKDIQKALDGMR